jgi:signal transduction histidine kinase
MLNTELRGKVEEYPQLTKTLSILESTNDASQIAFKKITKIVTNLRRFVRLDEADWQTTDIHEGIDSAIALVEPKFDNRVKVTRDYGTIPELYCSPGNLNQVFLEVIENGFESIENDGRVGVKTFLAGNDIKVEISDTGKGIDEQETSRVFDPGFTRKDVNVGVGLGLAICYKIVTDQHKGRIDVASEPGKGTTFTITLPCGADEQ